MGEMILLLREVRKDEASSEALHKRLSIINNLMNDQNLENGVELGLLTEFIQILIFFMNVCEPKECEKEFRLTVHCFAYCFKSIVAIDSFILLPDGLSTVVKIIEENKDKEILMNAIRVIKNCLRSKREYILILRQVPKLFTTLLKYTATEIYGESIIEKTMEALRNFTRKTEGLETIEDPKELEPLCRIALTESDAKYRNSVILVLRNCCKKQELLKYIKSTKAYELVLKYNNNY
eukprot:TRINITY_DN3627_c0_g2_i2.p1 TRINITY_DN3627_c0_g2~~TRINITY_DN3627_c0_g2_i2.p1  ORF type:complete len:236 (+),score=33.06 TRINITY_DN3627_c0_g2_i2:521-1228(+)